MTDTVYVDPHTWWERLYDSDVTDTHTPGDESDDLEEEAKDGTDGEKSTPPPSRWRKLLTQAVPEQPEEPATEEQPDNTALAEKLAAVGDTRRFHPANWAKDMDPRRAARWRRATYTGTAAFAGWSFGLPQYEQELLRYAAAAPAGTTALVLGLAAGTTAWRVFGRGGGALHRALQTGAGCLAATVTYQFGGTATAFIARWGFAPTLVAPLAAGVTVYALVEHLIDRRTRGWWPPLAWVMRIPLASAALAMALYTAR